MSSIARAGMDSAARAVKSMKGERRQKSEWLPPALLWLVTVMLIVAHQGTVLTLAFPVLSIAVGFWLYFKAPAKYVGYMWWLWFLSPEVRRFADWSNGMYTSTSPIQIAPLAVSMISGLSLIRFFSALAQRRGLPVLLMLSGIAYAFLVGIVSNGLLAALYDLANWIYPILIGFHIMTHWRLYHACRDVIVSTFIWGMLVTGAYGVVQFFFMPPWDVLWMTNAQMNSQGDPVPFGVRVFSTMNSSGPFAFVILGAMVYVAAAAQRIRWIASAFGFLSFGLSLVRAAWGGWMIALLIQLVKSSSRVRLHVIAGGVGLVILAIPVLMVGPIAERMQTRLQTVVNLGNDQSYVVRNQFYENFANMAFTNITGEGLGATGTSTKLSSVDSRLGRYGNFDSGVMNIPFVLGWPGTLLYVSGMIWILMRALLISLELRDDRFATANLSISFGILSMLVFTNSLVSTGGLLFFGSVFSIASAMLWKRSRDGRIS
ncbi:glucose-6-phosphate isomerase [Paraburkholderia caribensis]|uniref:glucose-6-phosphate isomerase n=1 Tax=Paraburkholderia caribensis TaxID=75105 RepID=UPI001D090CFF|nr:glucose-6-phosphate isomerase [Paraburkholderia caribensis]